MAGEAKLQVNGDGLSSEGTDELATPEEFALVNEQRSKTYALLSRLYRTEMDEESLAMIREAMLPVSTGNPQSDKGCHLIARAINNVGPGTLSVLAVDYAACFVGNGMDTFSAAYPYESVYESEKRLVMQAPRDEVLAIYRSEGLEKRESWKEMEDHIAAEFEFMQCMAYRCAESLREGDEQKANEKLETQLNFIRDHLTSWVYSMTADMRRLAKTDFYQGLACLTDGFLEMDRAFLEELFSVADEVDEASEDDIEVFNDQIDWCPFPDEGATA